MNNPFFSICVPVYNSGKQIIAALKSIGEQTFRDFEVVIVDNKSTDGTYEIIKEFLEKNNLKYSLFRNEKTISMINNWNKPLEYANGKYIAFLHHDDAFDPGHLEEAHNILIKNEQIGIYAVGNPGQGRLKTGLINPETYVKSLYIFEDISPPSETIFLRTYKDKRYVYYEKAVYSEMEVYWDICTDGFYVYHSSSRSVFRNTDKFTNSVTTNVYYTWTFFMDKFRIIEQFKNHKFINKQEHYDSLKNQIIIAIHRYFEARIRDIGDPDGIYQNILNISLRHNTYWVSIKLYFYKVISDLLNSKFLKKLLKPLLIRFLSLRRSNKSKINKR
jgi:glycosyltransferase involved in cell wall biosynthesis